MDGELYVRLEGGRARYEREVLARFGSVFGEADAEDLVGTALDRVLMTRQLPQPDKEEAWFRRLVSNVAIDEIRHRYGRGRSAHSQGALRSIVLLSELAELGIDVPDQAGRLDADAWMDQQAEEDHRNRVIALARVAADQLTEEQLRVLVSRHVEMPDASYEECAKAAGQSVHSWRNSYRRAWKKFVACVGSTEQTPYCRPTREMIGSLCDGSLPDADVSRTHTLIELHITDCPACRVFARDSYRVLEFVPNLPAGGLVVAGATAGGGVGLIAWLSAGGLGGAAKALVVVCGLTVTTAGICGGVVATLQLLRNPPPSVAAEETPSKPRPKPVASATPTRTPAPAPVRVAARTAKPPPTRRPRRSSRPPEKAQPAAVSTGSTGNEFDPVPENSKSQPSPVPAGVSGEFAP